MAVEPKTSLTEGGANDYEEWRASLMDTPEKRARYEQIAAENDLWLRLVEARQVDPPKGVTCTGVDQD